QQEGITQIAEGAIEEKENQHQTDRHHDLQPAHRLLQLLKLSSPFITISLWQAHVSLELGLRFGDGALQVTATDPELDRDVAAVIFAVDKRGARLLDNVRHLSERYIGSIGRGHWDIANGVDTVAGPWQEAHDHIEAPFAVQNLGHGLPTNGRLHSAVDIAWQ